MKLAVLFSGGKDSCLALHLAMQEGHEIKYLLTILPKNFDSFMFHKPYLELLEKQAEMLNADLIIMESPGIENKELGDLKKLIQSVENEIEGIAVGGIASSYQGNRIKKICDELNLEFYAPLWNLNGKEIWDLLLKEKFKIILTKISCEGISKEFLGRIIDRRILDGLIRLSEKYKFRIDFEGGEAESAVLFMPEFKKEIGIKNLKIKSEGKYRHYINKLELE